MTDFVEDLPSSVLTPRQREWLRDEADDLDAASVRAMRSRIRERVRAGVLDIELLLKELPVDDLELALSEPDSVDPGPTDVPPVERATSALAGMIYMRCHELERQLGQRDNDQEDGWRTSTHVRGGIEMALTRLGVAANEISVDIRVDRGKELETVAEEGDLSTVGRIQLARMKRKGLITAEEYSDEMSRRVLNMPPAESEEN